MGQQRDYEQYGQSQPRRPEARDDPRLMRPATPPQWGQEPSPRQDRTRDSRPPYPYSQAIGPSFTPGYQSQPGQPRGYYPPQPDWQQPYPPRYGQPPVPQRRKRRVFLWVFLAVQVLFLVWIIAGLASHPPGPTAAQQAAQQCAGRGWYPLFKSQADCQQHFGHALSEAQTAGKGIGVALIVVFWVVVDFFLGLGYGIYRLASRR